MIARVRTPPPSAATVRIDNDQVPPCRVCRAWLRRARSIGNVAITIHWPNGSWRVEDSFARDTTPHNRWIDAHEENGIVIIADENQNVSRWGFSATDPSADPLILQSDLFDEQFGPWQDLGETRSAFQTSVQHWNAANGGTLVTGIGLRAEGVRFPDERFSLVWRAADFRILHQDGAFVAASSGRITYVYGDRREDVIRVANSLPFEWFDIETHAGR
jgi:hypothetical protein